MQVQSGPEKKFVRTAMQAPYLERGEELGLALRWKQHRDQAAMHRIVQAHMRLVIAMAGRFRHYGLPMGDLIQEGHVGLLEAAARFEPDREIRFSTYAAWWIRASIQDHVLRNWSIVRAGTSSKQKALFFNLRRLRAKLAGAGEPMSAQDLHCEIAAALGASVKDVALMDSRLSGPDASLNAPLSDNEGEGAERQDLLVCDRPLPDETVGGDIDATRRRQWLDGALAVLSERELRIIRERRLSEATTTLECLGGKLGISKERVRQLESRALAKLRAALVDANPRMAAG